MRRVIHSGEGTLYRDDDGKLVGILPHGLPWRGTETRDFEELAAELSEYTLDIPAKRLTKMPRKFLESGRLIQTSFGGDPAWANGFILEFGEAPSLRDAFKSDMLAAKCEDIVNQASSKPLTEAVPVARCPRSDWILLAARPNLMAHVQWQFYSYFVHRYPSPTWWVSEPKGINGKKEGVDTALVVKQYGRRVGLVMPMMVTEPRLTVCRMLAEHVLGWQAQEMAEQEANETALADQQQMGLPMCRPAR